MKRILLAALAIALAVPLNVAAADDIQAEYVQTMTSLGASSPPLETGADVAVGNVVGCRGACLSVREMHFAATRNEQSGQAHGVLVQTVPAGTFRARVVCLTVRGNVATIGTVVEKSDGVFPEGTELLISVYDNGRNGEPAPDMFSFDNVGVPILEFQGLCLNPDFPPEFFVIEGDLRVHEG